MIAICNLCGAFSVPWDEIGQAVMRAHLNDCQKAQIAAKPLEAKTVAEKEGFEPSIPANPVFMRAGTQHGPTVPREGAQNDMGMTPEEIARAETLGPPDFLLGDEFDAENGQGASGELRGLAAENAAWPGMSLSSEHDLGEVEAGLNVIYAAAGDEMLGSLRSECVAALHRLRLKLRSQVAGEKTLSAALGRAISRVHALEAELDVVRAGSQHGAVVPREETRNG